jgi:hypothetical protein
MAKLEGMLRNIRNFALCTVAPIIMYCSCGNPVTPEEAPVLSNASYPQYTASTTVKGKLSYTGKAESAVVRVDGGAEQTVPLNPADSTFDITLTNGNGDKIIDTKAKGPGGNSHADIDIVTLITTTPVANSLSVPPYTSSNTITANVSASNADSMKVGENLSGAWTTYNTTSPVTLSLVDGNKTVYATFKDRMGNLSDTLSAITKLDRTAPSIPAQFKDTTFNDNKLYLGNFSIGDLANEYYKIWGATTADSGSLRNLDTLTLGEGTTYAMAFEQDSAGNITRDTARINATRLDSAGVLAAIKAFYSARGLSPADSLNKFTATDSLLRSFSETFNYSYNVGSVKHHVKACDTINPNAKNAFDYTTRLNKLYSIPARFFISGKDFLSSLNKKLLNFYNENM